ncbi:hypothetical protein F4818DRAFT_416508 [Hypoxylon cercidicola]|nr:hypothetical protein F4818DRAFT_416508 [Hypoxylon cercidicola]
MTRAILGRRRGSLSFMQRTAVCRTILCCSMSCPTVNTLLAGPLQMILPLLKVLLTIWKELMDLITILSASLNGDSSISLGCSTISELQNSPPSNLASSGGTILSSGVYNGSGEEGETVPQDGLVKGLTQYIFETSLDEDIIRARNDPLNEVHRSVITGCSLTSPYKVQALLSACIHGTLDPTSNVPTSLMLLLPYRCCFQARCPE